MPLARDLNDLIHKYGGAAGGARLVNRRSKIFDRITEVPISLVAHFIIRFDSKAQPSSHQIPVVKSYPLQVSRRGARSS